MNESNFFETMMDNIIDGIYILDDKGNYIFANSAYIQSLNMSKSVLLKYNVQDFLNTGQINFCISDIVYREKRQITMLQEVLDTQNFGRKPIRQLVISTPIFNESGEISNILAITRPIEKLDELYYQASKNAAIHTISGTQSFENSADSAVIAESAVMRNLLRTAATVALVDSNILITGESGTGKEVLTHYIHDSSPRSKEPLIIINCASIPENLLEAELFGYEKGAFTGAAPGGKKGLLEEADGGTLFLDEINSLPLNVQGKVLRAIETKTVQRVGSTRSRKVDFRLITATNEDLAKLVELKKFRVDLYYRLNVIPLHLPPLRERREDIVPLALHFLKHFCSKHSKDKVFTKGTLDNIINYPWPGNVRELKNFVERSVVMSLGRSIEVLNVNSFTDLVPKTPATAHMNYRETDTTVKDINYEQMLENGVSLDEYLNQCERGYIDYVLQKYNNTYKAADSLGTSQSSIIRRKKKYSL